MNEIKFSITIAEHNPKLVAIWTTPKMCQTCKWQTPFKNSIACSPWKPLQHHVWYVDISRLRIGCPTLRAMLLMRTKQLSGLTNGSNSWIQWTCSFPKPSTLGIDHAKLMILSQHLRKQPQTQQWDICKSLAKLQTTNTTKMCDPRANVLTNIFAIDYCFFNDLCITICNSSFSTRLLRFVSPSWRKYCSTKRNTFSDSFSTLGSPARTAMRVGATTLFLSGVANVSTILVTKTTHGTQTTFGLPWEKKQICPSVSHITGPSHWLVIGCPQTFTLGWPQKQLFRLDAALIARIVMPPIALDTAPTTLLEKHICTTVERKFHLCQHRAHHFPINCYCGCANRCYRCTPHCQSTNGCSNCPNLSPWRTEWKQNFNPIKRVPWTIQSIVHAKQSLQ